eukprot:2873227-Prymnesium_polylepis.1
MPFRARRRHRAAAARGASTARPCGAWRRALAHDNLVAQPAAAHCARAEGLLALEGAFDAHTGKLRL